MGRFHALVRTELKKAYRANPWFWVSTMAGCALAIAAALEDSIVFQNTIRLALEYWDTSDALYSATSCFSFWMLIYSHELAPGIFRMVWPLLAVLPYAWSWHVESRCGILDQQYVRADRRLCIAAKLSATFCSGAGTIALPALFNLIACACFAPATPVWASDMIYLGVTRDAPLSELFYTEPLVFCLVWTAVGGCVAGMWATFVAVLSVLVGSFLRAAVSSYLALHVLAFLGSQLRAVFDGLLYGDALGYGGLSLDVFGVILVNSAPGQIWLLIAVVLLLAIFSGISFLLRCGRDSL